MCIRDRCLIDWSEVGVAVELQCLRNCTLSSLHFIFGEVFNTQNTLLVMAVALSCLLRFQLYVLVFRGASCCSSHLRILSRIRTVGVRRVANEERTVSQSLPAFINVVLFLWSKYKYFHRIVSEGIAPSPLIHCSN